MSEKFVKICGERFIVDMMYARKNNMTGRAIYEEIGWGNLAVVHSDLWQKLCLLTPILQKEKLKLKICDAYRPREAHEIMQQLVPLKGFFAETADFSQHCHGTAVDVCLCDENGTELLYPTKVDGYEEKYCKQVAKGEFVPFMEHLRKAKQDFYDDKMRGEIANREYLRRLMESVGLEGIAGEWWHFNLPNGKSEMYPMVRLNAADYC